LRILITGKDGQVGWDLQRALAGKGEVVATDRQELDLSNIDGIRQIVRSLRPNLVINAAAYTAVDKAESEPDLVMRVNGTAPGVLAEECKRLGALLIHFSTDYVFDGSKRSPYTEWDQTGPINVYGTTKLAGEEAVRRSGARSLILRTAWVYAHRGRNFVLTMRRLARQKGELKVVNDQTGAPTWSRSLADLVAKICDKQIGEGAPIYHASCSGETTWYEFARTILDDLTMRTPKEPIARLIPISTGEYPTRARRPMYSVLSNSRLADDFGLRLPHWRAEFDEFASATAASSAVGS